MSGWSLAHWHTVAEEEGDVLHRDAPLTRGPESCDGVLEGEIEEFAHGIVRREMAADLEGFPERAMELPRGH